jgi:hypothetical protein
MPWCVTKIEICGFPKYACGHKLILLSDSKGHLYLAHLGIKERNLSPLIYWSRYLFSNKLTACIRLETDPLKIQNLLKLACFSKCMMWTVRDKVGEELLKKLQEQSGQKPKSNPYEESFNLYGKFFYDNFRILNGENCYSWATEILKGIQKTQGAPLNIADLIDGLNELKVKGPSLKS